MVEVLGDGSHVSKYRGFIEVRDARNERHRVDLDQVGTVVLTARDATISRAVVDECASRGIPIIFSGSNYAPSAMSIPRSERESSAERVRAQVNAPLPQLKRAWQQIVVGKIINQSKVLDVMSGELPARKVRCIAGSVKSGDTTNREAYAARLYWRALFGTSFRRDIKAAGINAHLNYGYALIRSSVARAVAASGLTASIGIHHNSSRNPFCLVDDLMEPFRPVVDLIVASLDEPNRLTPGNKRAIATVLQVDLQGQRGTTPLHTATYEMALSLTNHLLCKATPFCIPEWNPQDEDGNDAIGIRDHVDDRAV